ncbi:MAG: Glu-tRNA(Gln) amidotransferase subunit GatD, partial [Candidatus Woesearchaeota archaeon]|nr:Glu-tRNA(Gln) amidotransferase subunit GatD [Candidatus Woesearchaeota archaeon]
EEIVQMFPELKKVANIKSSLISNMFSENMRFHHYGLMAKAIEKEIKAGADGIILTHGTDTMHYTSSALAFMLENLPIPVLIVGSQRSSDRGSSDAPFNLLAASRFIATTNFKGVAICMHKSSNDDMCTILPPCKSRKMHSSRRDAFKPINADPIADIDASGKITWIKKPSNPKGKLVVKTKMEEKVALVKAHPNFSSEQLELYKKYKGLVIEGTGLGHIPATATNAKEHPNLKNLEAVRKLVAGGCIVVMTLQTLFGRVQMNVYAPGRELLKAGIISGEDMLPETAFIKLAWLLGNHKKDEAAKLINQNLRGEIADRTLYKEEFLD